MRGSISIALAVAATAALLVSCSQSETETRVGTALQLPRLTTDGDCAPEGTPTPTAADWAADAETVAIGTVVEMRPAGAPWVTLLRRESVADCDAPSQQGLDVVLEEVRATSDGTPDEIVVRITAPELLTWASQPTFDGDVVEWPDGEERGGIGYGMQLGGFLIQAQDGVYVSTGPMFAEDSRGELAFQGSPLHDRCPGALPSDVDGISFAALVAAVGAVPADDLDALRAWAERRYASSSLCGDPPPNSTRCREYEPGQFECPDGLECDEETMTCV